MLNKTKQGFTISLVTIENLITIAGAMFKLWDKQMDEKVYWIIVRYTDLLRLVSSS